MSLPQKLLALVFLAGVVSLGAVIYPGIGQTIPPGLYLPIAIRQELPPTIAPTATRTAQPTIASTPTPTATAQPALTPTATATLQLRYICDRDAYNCSDFNTQAAAQAVYNYCVNLGFGDIHKLDNNNDGEACESLP